jgi:hypothetical protein
MKTLKLFPLVFLIIVVGLTACNKKSTECIPEYREPLSFEIFKPYEDQTLDSAYVNKIHDTWQNELKDDEIIKNNTWLVGDYRVFVYLHLYTFFTNTIYCEMLFFTTTQPEDSTDQIHSTITAFEAEFTDTLISLTKIKTFVSVNGYHPIENEDVAKDIMIIYLDEYIAEYGTSTYDGSLIDYLKYVLLEDNYMWDSEDHYIYFRSPGDFGGTIIVNRLTSKMDFLGTSAFMGHGKRIFPSDD